MLRRWKPHPYLGTGNHKDIAEKGCPNYTLGDTESPKLCKYIPQHIGKREGNGSCVKIKEIENANHFYRHSI